MLVHEVTDPSRVRATKTPHGYFQAFVGTEANPLWIEGTDAPTTGGALRAYLTLAVHFEPIVQVYSTPTTTGPKQETVTLWRVVFRKKEPLVLADNVISREDAIRIANEERNKQASSLFGIYM